MAATLLLAAYIHVVVPSLPHAWKAPVRVSLLVLAAACAAVNAWAGAIDVGTLSDPRATQVLAVGAYVLLVLFAIVLGLLVRRDVSCTASGATHQNKPPWPRPMRVTSFPIQVQNPLATRSVRVFCEY